MNVCHVGFDNLNFSQALERVLGLLSSADKADAFFLNADCLYKTMGDLEYRNIINSADLVLPDGIGLRLIAGLFGGKMKEDCNGTDFCPALMEKAAEMGYSIFFLGGKDRVAEEAAWNIRRKIPGIKIVGTRSGYFTGNAGTVKDINASGADILFVGMGAPLQEKWIAENRKGLDPRLCLGVGALFDFLSGRVPRAPKLMRSMHLEWLWRIFIEPGRMFRRYIVDGARLFLLVLKYRFKGPGREGLRAGRG